METCRGPSFRLSPPMHSPDESKPILGASFVPRCHAGAMAARRGATVELREATKRYGDTVAVDHLSLTAAARRVCVLLRPAGCRHRAQPRTLNMRRHSQYA